MLPEPPPYVECHACHKTYWLKNAVEVGVMPWTCSPGDKYEPSWVSAPLVQSSSEAKFYEAIERLGEDGSVGEVRQLRILAWHKRNDPYRVDTSIPIELTEVARKNMQDLSLELGGGCKQGDSVSLENGLLIAELFREQGHHEFALEFLEKNNWASLQNFADQLAELCRQKNSRVVELTG
jgi:hypothetical protein